MATAAEKQRYEPIEAQRILGTAYIKLQYFQKVDSLKGFVLIKQQILRLENQINNSRQDEQNNYLDFFTQHLLEIMSEEECHDGGYIQNGEYEWNNQQKEEQQHEYFEDIGLFPENAVFPHYEPVLTHVKNFEECEYSEQYVLMDDLTNICYTHI